MEINAQVIVDFVKKHTDAFLIVLFGSYAKGQAHPQSDVDIAYCSDKQLNEYERFMLAQELAALLGRDVDLLDLTEATTVLQAQIVAGGQVLYCSDDERRQYFFIKILKEYTLLNEERAVLLQAIERRGRVYGK